jgi:hypothetical protein
MCLEGQSIKLEIIKHGKIFKMKKSLPDVTLLAYTSHEVKETIWSLNKCQEKLNFAEIKLLTHEMPVKLPSHIIWEYAPKINNINDFNKYMFLDLGKHINTSHMLYVQAHSWIVNPNLWTNEFLEFSYIGAPWKIVENSYMANDGTISRVGNGGFSLRDSRLLNLPKKMGWGLREEQGWLNEDGNICCYYRKEMLDNGIKYAPLEVACKFSYENTIPENIGIKPFGFHRNMCPW